MDDDSQRVFQLASRVHDSQRPSAPLPEGQVTISRASCVVEPLEALTALRSSAVAQLMPPDDAVLNHPERPWFAGTVIRANPNELTAVLVTAQTWIGHLEGRGRASELTIGLRFGRAPVHVDEQYALWTSDDRPLVLSRTLFDYQRARAELGYEGDGRMVSTPSAEQVEDFLEIVRQVSGVA